MNWKQLLEGIDCFIDIFKADFGANDGQSSKKGKQLLEQTEEIIRMANKHLAFEHCPECQSKKIQTLGVGAQFCHDCDWDNLSELSKNEGPEVLINKLHNDAPGGPMGEAEWNTDIDYYPDEPISEAAQPQITQEDVNRLNRTTYELNVQARINEPANYVVGVDPAGEDGSQTVIVAIGPRNPEPIIISGWQRENEWLRHRSEQDLSNWQREYSDWEAGDDPQADYITYEDETEEDYDDNDWCHRLEY
jgi:ribosomal protein L37AE/L43A